MRTRRSAPGRGGFAVRAVDERVPAPVPVSAASRFEALALAQALEPGDVTVEAPTGWEEGLPDCPLLDGEWRRWVPALALPQERPRGELPPVEDALWPRVVVPDCWGAEPALAHWWGPVWYRTRLPALDAPCVQLVFDAVDTHAEVHLDGELLGTHVGAGVPFAFDLAGRYRAGAVLDVGVTAAFEPLDPGVDAAAVTRRGLAGALGLHATRPGGAPGADVTPGWTPERGQAAPAGGITASVWLNGTGHVRLDEVLVTTLDPGGPGPAELHVAVVVTSARNRPLRTRLLLALSDPGGAEVGAAGVACTLQSGPNRLDLRVSVPAPVHWTPATPVRYALDVVAAVEGVASDRRRVPVGLRTVGRSDDGSLALNGEPLVLRALEAVPRVHLAGWDADSAAADVAAMAATGANAVALTAHLSGPELYEAADAAGLLVWQDAPFTGRYVSGAEDAPGFVEAACRWLADAAYRLWNHPSVVCWSPHDDPPPAAGPRDAAHDPDNQVLDRALERTLRLLGAGAGPPVLSLRGPATVDRRARLRAETAAGLPPVAPPGTLTVVRAGGWPTLSPGSWIVNDPVWPPDEAGRAEWAARLGRGALALALAGDPGRAPDVEAWGEALDLVAAARTRTLLDALRVAAPGRSWALRWESAFDTGTAGGTGALGSDRAPKALAAVLASGLRPVLVTAQGLPASAAGGETVGAEVVVVSDVAWDVEVAVSWAWVAWPEAVVVRADPEPATGAGGLALGGVAGAPAWVAQPWGPSAEVLAEGDATVTVPAGSVAVAATVDVRQPRAGAGGALTLTWQVPGLDQAAGGAEASGWSFVALASAVPDGPGAWVIGAGPPRRLGAGERRGT